ncbi:MAG TPA: DegT/DnrJ/EryC1/StrS family aminotransferase, partial [Firmicutes bacterium]|nr:DegT/DnrJ/EryC1/StrS family aminotransferase [Bacillota bacterium]
YRVGGNYRMPAMCAALLRVQLARYPEAHAKRTENGTYLAQRLSEIPGLEPTVVSPKVTRHAWHLFIWRYDAKAFDGVSRDAFLEAMRKEGVPAYQGYSIPLTEQPVFAEKRFDLSHPARNVDFTEIAVPVAKRACESEACWLTQNVLLGSKADMDDIVTAARKIYENRHELVKRSETAS